MQDAEALTVNLTQAFSSPILRFQIPGASTLNPILIKEANLLRQESSGIRRSNRQGWHSKSDLMTRQEPGLAELARFIEKSIHAATKVISPEFNFRGHRLMTEGWININPQHGYNVPHRHHGYLWSGCYYVTVPRVEEGPSGCIEFLSPFVIPGEYEVFNAACYKEKITMRPNAGDILLFPSYLTHWVFPNDAAEERITIAFNGAYLPQ